MRKFLDKSGNIPKGEMCPFTSSCVLWKNKVDNTPLGRVPTESVCKHQGKDHPTPFSCGTARGFDITKRIKELEETIDKFSTND